MLKPKAYEYKELGTLREATIKAEEQLLASILIMCSDQTTEAIDYCKKISLQPDDFLDHFYTDPDNQRSRIFKGMLECQWPNQICTAQKMYELGILRPSDIKEMSLFISRIDTPLDYDLYAGAVKKYSIQRKIDYLNKTGKINEIPKLTIKSTGGIKI